MKFKQVELTIPPQIFIPKEELQQQNHKDVLLLETMQNSLKMLKEIIKIDIYQDQQNMQEVVSFYKDQQHMQKEQLRMQKLEKQQNKNIVLPILCLKNRSKNNFKTLTILLQKQGVLLSKILDYLLEKNQKEILLNFKNLVQKLHSIKFYPILNLQNIYLKQFNLKIQIQIAPTDRSIDEKHFVEKLKVILGKVVKSDKTIKQKLSNNNVQSLSQIMKICDAVIQKHEEKQQKKKQIVQQKYSMKNMLSEWQIFEKANQKLPTSSKIQITQEVWTKMFKSLDIQVKSKEFLVSGKDINFSPSVLHKKIEDKGPLLYIIQDELSNRISFLTYFKLPKRFQPLFGTYFNDESLKAAVYDLKTSRIFRPKDQAYSLGYGPEIFLAIGKLDIIISAFNINNFCYFPYTFQIQKHKLQQKKSQFGIVEQPEQQMPQQQEIRLFEKEFIVKNLDIYQLTIIQRQKEKTDNKKQVKKKQESKNNTKPKKQDANEKQKIKTHQKLVTTTPVKAQLNGKSREKSTSKSNLDKTGKK